VHNDLGDRGVNALKPGAEKIASRHSRNGDQLAALAIIAFERDRQVNSVIHQEGEIQHKVTTKLMRESKACLNRIRIVVVRGSFRHSPVGLTR